jgi:hypothetical protein
VFAGSVSARLSIEPIGRNRYTGPFQLLEKIGSYSRRKPAGKGNVLSANTSAQNFRTSFSSRAATTLTNTEALPISRALK